MSTRLHSLAEYGELCLTLSISIIGTLLCIRIYNNIIIKDITQINKNATTFKLPNSTVKQKMSSY